MLLFENIEMHDAHDVLLCIAAGVVKEQSDRPHASNQCYFKSAKEMALLFQDLPEAIENSYYIMKRSFCYGRAYIHQNCLNLLQVI
jgi:DNA polymerase-3 subunit alpha